MGSSQSSHAKGTKKTIKEPIGARGHAVKETTPTPIKPEQTVEFIEDEVLVINAVPAVLSVETDSEIEDDDSVASTDVEEDSDDGKCSRA